MEQPDLSNPLVMRAMMQAGDEIRDAGLESPSNIVRYDSIQYGKDSTWNLLDVYHLEGVNTPSPTIISVHGGGWVYGDKERYQYYCMDLAQRGFTVVNFTYRLAPEHKFPSPLEDINAVFEWIAENAEKYNIDPKKVFTVGDSAGGQLSSQYLAIFTNPEYQKLFDFKVPSDKIKVLACGLNCGIYDVKKTGFTGPSEVLRCYIDIEDEKSMAQIDTVKYVSENFPPSFVMTSFYDFLREEAEPFCELLKSKNVPFEFRLYGKEGEEHMGHVFHCNMRLAEAKTCNDDECDFFKKFI